MNYNFQSLHEQDKKLYICLIKNMRFFKIYLNLQSHPQSNYYQYIAYLTYWKMNISDKICRKIFSFNSFVTLVVNIYRFHMVQEMGSRSTHDHFSENIRRRGSLFHAKRFLIAKEECLFTRKSALQIGPAPLTGLQRIVAVAIGLCQQRFNIK